MKKLLALTACALLLTACSQPGAGKKPTVDPSGSWGSHAPRQPWLDLDPDGTVMGNDGCNQLRGSWQNLGDTVEFSAMSSTRMYCEGVDTWLNHASTATVQGGALHLKDAKDQQIGTLSRTD